MTQKQAIKIFVILIYFITLLLYLYAAWKYDLSVSYGPSSLKDNNSIVAAYQQGLLLQFLVLEGLRVLGGVMLALPHAFYSFYHALNSHKSICLKWDLSILLIVPLLIPVLGFAYHIKLSVMTFLFLVNGYTRIFCAIAIGYLLVPKIELKKV